jgi:hypothetical protein
VRCGVFFSSLFPSKQALEAHLHLVPFAVFLQRYRILVIVLGPLLVEPLLLLGLAALTLAILLLLLLVQDRHTRRARFKSRSLGDSRVPESGRGNWGIGGLTFTGTFRVGKGRREKWRG